MSAGVTCDQLLRVLQGVFNNHTHLTEDEVQPWLRAVEEVLADAGWRDARNETIRGKRGT